MGSVFPLGRLGLSARTIELLAGRQIDTVGLVLTLDPQRLLEQIPGFEPAHLLELRDALTKAGFLPEPPAEDAGEAAAAAGRLQKWAQLPNVWPEVRPVPRQNHPARGAP